MATRTSLWYPRGNPHVNLGFGCRIPDGYKPPLVASGMSIVTRSGNYFPVLHFSFGADL
jgi:hypothetical protein